MADNRCEQCLTEGITLLPLRWGCKFEEKDVKEYNRLIREGYIYILDNRGKWYGYVVTQGRYFKDFDVKNVAKTPDLPLLDVTCFKGDNCTALNSFIRIPNPKRDITTLWCAYSPVKWTKAVIDRHQNNTDNAKTNNMIEVPVSATQSKNTSSLGTIELHNSGGYDLWQYIPHGGEITQYYATEYFGDINPFTNHPYSPDKSSETNNLRDELLKVEKNGARVLRVLFNDAIGKLIDLNEFMIQAQLQYQPPKSAVQGYTVGRLIQNLKENIDAKAKTDAQNYIDIMDKRTEHLQTIPRWEGDGPSEAEQRAESQRREEGAARYIERQRQGAWSDYSDLIRENEMDRWLLNFEASSKKRQTELDNILTSLATEYKIVFESEHLRNMMTYCFDKKDDTSRVHYTLTVQHFLGTTANIPMLADFYAEQMNTKSANDMGNYIARGLIFNQDEVAQNVEAISTSSGLDLSDVSTVSWSGLLYAGSADIFTKYDLLAKETKVIVSLTEQLSTPFLNILQKNKIIDKLRPSRSHFLFGYHSEMGLFYVTGYGNYIQAKNALIKGISQLSGKSISKSKITDSVEKALSSLGEKVDGKNKISKKFLYFVKKERLDTSIKAYSNSQKAPSDLAKLKIDISATVYNEVALHQGHHEKYKSFEEIIDRKIETANTRSYMGSMLQGIACIFMVKALADSSDKMQDGSKAGAGIAMLIAGEVERSSNAAKFRKTNLEMMQSAGKSIDAVELGRLTTTAGRFAMIAGVLNIGGAVVFAAWDIKSAYNSNENDNTLSTGLYISSAATGLASTAFLVIGGVFATPGLILLVGFIGINLAIGFFVNTGIENWLQYGTWGNKSSNWSIEHELEQYKKALAGEDIDLKDN